eukprot:jgi/Botrbrau1/16561/Bobra.0385s0004.1
MEHKWHKSRRVDFALHVYLQTLQVAVKATALKHVDRLSSRGHKAMSEEQGLRRTLSRWWDFYSECTLRMDLRQVNRLTSPSTHHES